MPTHTQSPPISWLDTHLCFQIQLRLSTRASPIRYNSGSPFLPSSNQSPPLTSWCRVHVGPHNQARLTCLTRVNILNSEIKALLYCLCSVFPLFLKKERKEKKFRKWENNFKPNDQLFLNQWGRLVLKCQFKWKVWVFLALRVPGIRLFTVYFLETQFIESLALFWGLFGSLERGVGFFNFYIQAQVSSCCFSFK